MQTDPFSKGGARCQLDSTKAFAMWPGPHPGCPMRTQLINQHPVAKFWAMVLKKTAGSHSRHSGSIPSNPSPLVAVGSTKFGLGRPGSLQCSTVLGQHGNLEVSVGSSSLARCLLAKLEPRIVEPSALTVLRADF